MDEEFSIGYWIKRRRKALDMTQKDLANGVGCALITIAKIEADQRRPSREIAGLLAENLKIPEEQRADFIRILRGQKSAIHLRKIAVTGFQTPEEPMPYPDAPSRILSSEMDKFRGLELIGKISHSRLVRRNAEVIRARNLWGQVKSGESQVLIIQGEPGIGKTRLARELVSEIKTMGGLVLVGECFAEGGMPYAPFVNILQSEVNFPLGLPNPVLADLRTIAPQLAARLPEVPTNPPLDTHAEQWRLFESVFTYFRWYYENKPLLILIEDIHWADHGSLTLIQSLAQRFRVARAPVLILLTTREVSPDVPSLNTLFNDLLRAHLSTVIHLECFDQSGTGELLTAIFSQEITDEFTELMQRETQGNPFFIEEVCKDLLESGKIYWEKGRWERKKLTELRTPHNIRVAIQTRLDKLEKETQEILQTASAIGRRFEFDVLQHILQTREDELIDRLEEARAAQIIQETGEPASGGVFAFSHVLIASVLREGTSAPRRRKIHKRIVKALEKIHPNDLGLLAYHCREAGENAAAVSYFHKAGDYAMRAFAHEDAIHFYSEALILTPKESREACQILLARAKVYDLRGERSLQLADLQAAEAKAEALQDTSLHAAVALARGEYAIQVVEQPDVIEYARRAIALSEQACLPAITAQAYMLWGRVFSETGELNESGKYLLQAVKIAREAGLGLIEARSMINLGNLDYRLGNYVSAREKYSASLPTVRKLGERRIEGMALNNLGNVYAAEGDYEMALRSYRESLDIARSIGDRLNEMRGLSNIGSILSALYQYDEALQILEQALPLVQQIGQRADEGIAWGHLADVMEMIGRYDQAHEYRMKAREILHQADDPQGEAEMLASLCRIDGFRGKFESAEEFARQAISIAQKQGYPVEEAAAWEALGLSRVIAKSLTAGEDAYAKSLELYQRINQGEKCSELRAELAWLAYERGDLELAQKHMDMVLSDRNQAALTSIQQPSICWCGYEVLKDQEPETARILLEHGYSMLCKTAERITDPGARERYLKQLPHHKALAEAWKSKRKRQPQNVRR